MCVVVSSVLCMYARYFTKLYITYYIPSLFVIETCGYLVSFNVNNILFNPI